ncbi:MAG: hypothetical protein Q7W02_00100 [Candidatus Rokubacteria bacterium]|nr:hypothetical protein [Candidatus Rokubacteria bacterium]
MSDGLDEILTEVWGLPPGRTLADLSPAWPSPTQLALAKATVRRAVWLGLRLPRVTWRFVTADGEPGWAAGETDPRRGVPVTIYMRVDVLPEQWEKVLYHECKHASDVGLMLDRRYTTREFEARAINFADYAMATRP